MAYIPSYQTLRDHPKLKRLTRRLQIKEPQAIGHLHLLWWWSLDYAPNGSLYGRDVLDIAIASQWDGDENTYTSALIECGFIDDAGNGELSIHDWDEYGGKYQEKRERDAARKRDERAVRRTNNVVHQSSTGRPKDVGVTARIEEKRRVDKSKPPVNPPNGAQRGSRLPDEFAITDELRCWAQGEVPGLDIDFHHKQFCRYWWGETGRHAIKIRWDLTWQKWMAKEARDHPPKGLVNGAVIDWKTAKPEQIEAYRVQAEREMLRQL